MTWAYRNLVRPVLFTQDAERVHERTLRTLGWISRHELLCESLETFFGSPPLPVDCFGLRFPNPVGLAAGMDKFAQALPAWAALGFGFSELGGVTFHAQPGNPAPRLFRIVGDGAIINRMGFNNSGVETMAGVLKQWRHDGRWPRHPVGINLGKSKSTPLENAAAEYAACARVLRPHVDFFVVNVSSPNTPNLRQLQDRSALDEILAALDQAQQETTSQGDDGSRPVLVKVAPDLSFEALDEILELTGPRKVAGIVATNTTISRPAEGGSATQGLYSETGGLSGKPLRARSTEVIGHLFRQTRGKLPIIGVGGIFNADDAWEKITNGATLVQVYTGLVFEGPGLVREIVSGLQEKMEAAGFKTISQAIGANIC